MAGTAPGALGVPGGYRVWIDGREVASASASVSVFDHGFLYGDSIYEVLRTVGDRLVRARAHLERLERSARALRLVLPLAREALEEEIRGAVRAHGGDCYVRLVVTRGAGDISLLPDTCEPARRILYVTAYRPFAPRLYHEGVRVVLVGVQRNAARAIDPGVKSGNYLNSVLALMEARERGAEDGLMLNAQGELTEATTSNVFVVRRGVLETPPLEAGILGGVTRAAILEEWAPALGLESREVALSVADLMAADEAFLSSTLKGVMPIARIDGCALPAPIPGRQTRALMAAATAELDALR